MITNLLLEAVATAGTAFGIWGVTLYRKNGKNGHPPEPAPRLVEDWQRAQLAEIMQPLSMLPRQLEASFDSGVERLAKALEPQPAAPPPEPTWPAELERSFLAYGAELTRSIEGLAERLEVPILPPQPDLSPALLEISQRLESAVERGQHPELMAQLTQLPAQLSRQLAELIAAERNRTPKSAPHGKSEGGGGQSEASNPPPPPPPPRRPPPTIMPLAAPNPVAPAVPAPYVAGAIFAPVGQVANVLALIQQQLSPNCPGTSVSFRIGLDATGPVYVGAASSIGGPLSATNYAYQLKVAGDYRLYTTSYPGNSTPIGELQVLAPNGDYLQVEVQS